MRVYPHLHGTVGLIFLQFALLVTLFYVVQHVKDLFVIHMNHFVENL